MNIPIINITTIISMSRSIQLFLTCSFVVLLSYLWIHYSGYLNNKSFFVNEFQEIPSVITKQNANIYSENVTIIPQSPTNESKSSLLLLEPDIVQLKIVKTSTTSSITENNIQNIVDESASISNSFHVLANPSLKVLWKYATGGQVYSSPVIGSDGTMYIGSYDSKVYALTSWHGEVCVGPSQQGLILSRALR